MIARGSCLCGAVAFEADLPFARFVNCHCSRCRKISGSAYAANAVVKASAFRWTRGEEQVRRFDLLTAQRFVSCFCGTCGSSLPHPVRGIEVMVIPSGTLDDDPGLTPEMHVYWGSRAPWISDAGDLPVVAEGLPPSAAAAIAVGGGKSDAGR